MPMIDQVFPVKQKVSLEGLYLGQRLLDVAKEIGRSIVLTNFLTDKNGVIATLGKDGQFQVPAKIKNSSDWRLFQELMAQSDIIISGGSYFRRLAANGAQDILYQFETGNEFEALGQWRLNAGYKQRSPDLAIVTRRLDFTLPEELLRSDRKIIIFTTDAMPHSEDARELQNAGVTIIGSGVTGVEGDRLIDTLAHTMGYRVIMMVTGPQVLDLLLSANRLDLLYVTQAQAEIPVGVSTKVQTILLEGKKVSELKAFRLAHQFVQENVVAEDGSLISQSFLRYDRKEIREE